ncbi:MAG: tetratricopeptide repeat protein, partial [Stenotrophobium sp.]
MSSRILTRPAQIHGSAFAPRQEIIAFVVLALLVATPVRADLGVPYLPQSDGQVLQELPSTSDPRVRAFDALRRQQQEHPDDMALALKLARDYIDYGRITGDARYLGRALAVIAPWLKRTPVPMPVMMVNATILQSRHLFVQSRAILEQILKADSDNGQAWLTLASVAQVQGDMDKARHSCARLMGSMDALITAACIGGLDAVTGRANDGYEVIALLLKQEPNEPPLIQSWAQGLLADAAKYQGEDTLADAHFKAALQLVPGDNFLLADYGDFLLDHKRPREVIALVRDYTQSDTSFLRLVLAEAMLKLPQAGKDTQEMAQRFRD